MSEARLLEGLSGLSIGPSDHAALAKLPVHAADSNSFTVDIRNESIIVSDYVITPPYLLTGMRLFHSLSMIWKTTDTIGHGQSH